MAWKRKPRVRGIEETSFGDQLVFDMPAGADVVVICTQGQGGLEPISLCLPHQVYVDDVRKVMAKHDCSEVVVIPARAADYVRIDRQALFMPVKS